MNHEDYVGEDALGLAARIEAGEVSASEVLDASLAARDRLNPELNAVVIDLEAEARQAIERGLPNGPFSGVPFLLKDLHLHLEGARLTNGCRMFEDQVSDHDSEMVARYKRAGLVVFGRSASPEFGLTTTTESAVFGQTRNPWNLEHTSGGSSGGASAAVAAGILPAANASDGGGSIRIPAACCGLFGLKPSRGNIPFGPDSGEGWSGMSTVHAVTRSVRDSAALLDATCGADVGAPYPAPAKSRDYLDEVERDPASLRIGLITRSFNGTETHPDCIEAVEDAARLCESLGHTVEPLEIQTDAEALSHATNAIIGGNLAATLDARAAELGREVKEGDVEGLTWVMAAAAGQRSAADYARAQRTIHAAGRMVSNHLQTFDLLLSPTMGAPPTKLGELSLSNPDIGSMVSALTQSVGYTQLLNATGSPAMSVPLCWNAAGLPIGIQFVGDLGREGLLFQLAGQLERARPWFDRRPGIA